MIPNDLDRAIQALQRSQAALPELCRCLSAGELWVLVPFHPEVADGKLELKAGAPLPFVRLNSEDGATVPVFSSEARLLEGLRAGKVPPRTYLPATLPALQLLQILSSTGLNLTINKGCATGEVTVPPELVRDLADGSALKPLGMGSGQRQQVRLVIVNPADYPTDLLQSVFELFRQRTNFRAAWLFTRKDEEQPPSGLCTWYMLVLMDPRDEVIFHDFNLVAQNARGQHELSTSLARETDAAEIARLFRQAQPFYVAADYRPPLHTQHES